jgi:hypothetical protein
MPLYLNKLVLLDILAVIDDRQCNRLLFTCSVVLAKNKEYCSVFHGKIRVTLMSFHSLY